MQRQPIHEPLPAATSPVSTRASIDGVASEAIAVERLTKAYGSTRAVDELSFTVATGEVFALLGPNGAGKTTVIEILEGYRRSDAGVVRVLGLDPQRDTRLLKTRVGVMLQQDGLHPGLTAREAIQLYASFFPAPLDPIDLLGKVGLDEAQRTRCRRLSGGQKRRLALAIALVGAPLLVFLDEPTTGMDPQARLGTWEIIRELRRNGTTVVLTTHVMDEAERLADRVAIIDRGRLVALDTPQALVGGADHGTLRLVARPGLDTAALGRLPAAEQAREDEPGRYTLRTSDPAQLAASVTAWLHDHDVTLLELRVGHGSLEETFLRLTGREDRV